MMTHGNWAAWKGQPLTEKEFGVLLAFADGERSAEVADELHVKKETVRYYTATIRTKMGARNMTHAVALAYDTGLLKPRGAACASQF